MGKQKRKRPQPAPKPKSSTFTKIGGSPVPGLTLRHVLRGYTNRTNRIAWPPDGAYLALPSYDKTIRISDMCTGACMHTLQGHTNEVISVAWSPDGQRLASASGFFQQEEQPTLLQRRQEMQLRVIPIIVRPCKWQSEPVLKDLQALPKNGKAVITFSETTGERDQVWTDIATVIENRAEAKTTI